MNESRPARRSWWLWGTVVAGFAILLLLVAGSFFRPVLHDVPPIPPGIEDLEVRDYLEQIRAETVADRGSAIAWGELGLALTANQFDRDADICLAEASRLDGRDIRWPLVRALIASKRTPEKTIPLLRQAVAGTKPGPEYHSTAALVLAETLLEQGELEEAEKLFREESKNSANRARSALGLGLVAKARRDDKSAVEYLTVALDDPSSRIRAMIPLAALARARGDVAAAVAMEKEAATLPDDRPWPDPVAKEVVRHKVGRRAHEREISDLEAARDFHAAARAYLRQIEQTPTAEAYVGAAVNLARVHKYDLADQYLEKALELDPERAKTHYTIALVNMIRAEREFANNPSSPRTARWFRSVVSSAQRATELKPDYAQAYLFWGLALKHLGEPQAAVEPFRKGIACRPDLFDLQLALGQVLLETEQKDEAKQALENAQRLRPEDPRLVAALKDLADSKGN